MNQMNKDSNSINITGLTDEEVRQRVEEGFTNRTDISTDKTTKEIVVSNVFTYFNLIFLVITILLIMVGSFRNLTFLPIIIGNTVIGIVQEIRAKKTLEKMSLLNAPHADVIRNGSVKQISTEELVKDDVILLTAGKQICADAVVISGNIQVNESLLTGEADEVEKTEGSTLMSGSFVVSGECYARLEKVGNESYISKLSLEAKSMGGKEQSEMIRSINLIVKWVGIVIIPIGLILFWQSHFVNGESITKSVTSTVAAIIGMIPEGLSLLTTVALALSTMKLARKKVLLHDMKSIETLARVDVLCVDKTGTITEPDMKLKEIFLCKNSGADGTQTALTLDELKSLILDYANASVDNNATMLALKAYAAEALTNNTSALHRTAVSQQAFSSSLKYGSVTFSDGTYLLGAPEFIMHEDFARIEELTRSAVNLMLGFEIRHIGIHGTNADEGLATAKRFSLLFGWPLNPGSGACVVGNCVESLYSRGRGTNGHIAVATNHVARAMAHLRDLGVEFAEDSISMKDGKPTVAYLKEELGGFAVHLIQK